MFWGVEWGSLFEDQLDRVIVESESRVAGLRAIEMAAIAEKRRRGSHRADGYRSIIDWVAARADVSHRTARRLCWTATRLGEAPEVAEALEAGGVSFDRAEQVARLPEGQRSDHLRFDIAQLKRRVAHYRRLTPRRERGSVLGYLSFQPSLDETTTHLWGELPGVDSLLVCKAVDQRADELLSSDAGLGVAERRALGLVAICQDSLYTAIGSPGSVPARVIVTVDARTAARSNAETGVAVLNGPRIGVKALEAVTCDSIVEVVGVTETGEPLDLGRNTRTVSPALRRHVLARDMGCTVEGCSSSYRLEAHHTTTWSEGGRTDAENLVSLCWYHHHVAVHRLGHRIFRIATSRIRLKRPT